MSAATELKSLKFGSASPSLGFPASSRADVCSGKGPVILFFAAFVATLIVAVVIPITTVNATFPPAGPSLSMIDYSTLAATSVFVGPLQLIRIGYTTPTPSLTFGSYANYTFCLGLTCTSSAPAIECTSTFISILVPALTQSGTYTVIVNSNGWQVNVMIAVVVPVLPTSTVTSFVDMATILAATVDRNLLPVDLSNLFTQLSNDFNTSASAVSSLSASDQAILASLLSANLNFAAQNFTAHQLASAPAAAPSARRLLAFDDSFWSNFDQLNQTVTQFTTLVSNPALAATLQSISTAGQMTNMPFVPANVLAIARALILSYSVSNLYRFVSTSLTPIFNQMAAASYSVQPSSLTFTDISAGFSLAANNSVPVTGSVTLSPLSRTTTSIARAWTAVSTMRQTFLVPVLSVYPTIASIFPSGLLTASPADSSLTTATVLMNDVRVSVTDGPSVQCNVNLPVLCWSRNSASPGANFTLGLEWTHANVNAQSSLIPVYLNQNCSKFDQCLSDRAQSAICSGDCTSRCSVAADECLVLYPKCTSRAVAQTICEATCQTRTSSATTYFEGCMLTSYQFPTCGTDCRSVCSTNAFTCKSGPHTVCDAVVSAGTIDCESQCNNFKSTEDTTFFQCMRAGYSDPTCATDCNANCNSVATTCTTLSPTVCSSMVAANVTACVGKCGAFKQSVETVFSQCMSTASVFTPNCTTNCTAKCNSAADTCAVSSPTVCGAVRSANVTSCINQCSAVQQNANATFIECMNKNYTEPVCATNCHDTCQSRADACALTTPAVCPSIISANTTSCEGRCSATKQTVEATFSLCMADFTPPNDVCASNCTASCTAAASACKLSSPTVCQTLYDTDVTQCITRCTDTKQTVENTFSGCMASSSTATCGTNCTASCGNAATSCKNASPTICSAVYNTNQINCTTQCSTSQSASMALDQCTIAADPATRNCNSDCLATCQSAVTTCSTEHPYCASQTQTNTAKQGCLDRCASKIPASCSLFSSCMRGCYLQNVTHNATCMSECATTHFGKTMLGFKAQYDSNATCADGLVPPLVQSVYASCLKNTSTSTLFDVADDVISRISCSDVDCLNCNYTASIAVFTPGLTCTADNANVSLANAYPSGWTLPTNLVQTLYTDTTCTMQNMVLQVNQSLYTGAGGTTNCDSNTNHAAYTATGLLTINTDTDSCVTTTAEITAVASWPLSERTTCT